MKRVLDDQLPDDSPAMKETLRALSLPRRAPVIQDGVPATKFPMSRAQAEALRLSRKADK